MSVPSTPVDLASMREAVCLILENNVSELKYVSRYTTSAVLFNDMPYSYLRVSNLQYSIGDAPWGPLGATDCIVSLDIYVLGRMNSAGDNEQDERLSDTIAAKLRPAFESDPLLTGTGTALAINTTLETVEVGLMPDIQPDAQPMWVIKAQLTSLVTT